MRDNRISDAEQWQAFCDSIKVAGMEILDGGTNADPVNKSEGIRYLARMLRGALETYVEYSDPIDPVLFKRTHARLKYGFDNPDNIYSTCAISDRHQYELRGNKGTVGYLSINLSTCDTTGRMLPTGFLEGTDLVADDGGNFVVLLGGAPQERNWLAIPRDTNTLMVRQSFLDRSRESEAHYEIRRLSPRAALSQGPLEARAAENLAHAAQWFCGTGKSMLGWANNLLPTMNQLPPADQDYVRSLGADPRMYYYWSSWRLGQGESLLIHLPEIPAAGMWSLCLTNVWLESLDYTQHRINLNSATAKSNADGSVTMAIADTDPGIANWLETCGHSQGCMMFRWTKADRVVNPQVELVKLSAVDMQDKLRRWIR